MPKLASREADKVLKEELESGLYQIYKAVHDWRETKAKTQPIRYILELLKFCVTERKEDKPELLLKRDRMSKDLLQHETKMSSSCHSFVSCKKCDSPKWACTHRLSGLTGEKQEDDSWLLRAIQMLPSDFSFVALSETSGDYRKKIRNKICNTRNKDKFSSAQRAKLTDENEKCSISYGGGHVVKAHRCKSSTLDYGRERKGKRDGKSIYPNCQMDANNGSNHISDVRSERLDKNRAVCTHKAVTHHGIEEESKEKQIKPSDVRDKKKMPSISEEHRKIFHLSAGQQLFGESGTAHYEPIRSEICSKKPNCSSYSALPSSSRKSGKDDETPWDQLYLLGNEKIPVQPFQTDRADHSKCCHETKNASDAEERSFQYLRAENVRNQHLPNRNVCHCFKCSDFETNRAFSVPVQRLHQSDAYPKSPVCSSKDEEESMSCRDCALPAVLTPSMINVCRSILSPKVWAEAPIILVIREQELDASKVSAEHKVKRRNASQDAENDENTPQVNTESKSVSEQPPVPERTSAAHVRTLESLKHDVERDEDSKRRDESAEKKSHHHKHKKHKHSKEKGATHKHKRKKEAENLRAHSTAR